MCILHPHYENVLVVLCSEWQNREINNSMSIRWMFIHITVLDLVTSIKLILVSCSSSFKVNVWILLSSMCWEEICALNSYLWLLFKKEVSIRMLEDPHSPDACQFWRQFHLFMMCCITHTHLIQTQLV